MLGGAKRVLKNADQARKTCAKTISLLLEIYFQPHQKKHTFIYLHMYVFQTNNCTFMIMNDSYNIPSSSKKAFSKPKSDNHLLDNGAQTTKYSCTMHTLSTAILTRASFTEGTNYAQPTLGMKAALTFKGFFHWQGTFLDRLGFLESKRAFVHQFSCSCCKQRNQSK